MTEEDKIFGLIAVAEEHQKAVTTGIEGLAAERAALARAVKGLRGAAEEALEEAARQSLAGASETAVAAFSKASEPFKKEMREVADKASDAAARVRSAAGWIGVKAVAVTVGLIVIVGLTASISLAWEHHRVSDLSAEAAQLRSQIAQERVTVAELDKRGGRVHWDTCGGRLCFEASSNQGTEGDGAAFRKDAGWITVNGKVPLVVPRGY
jgi:hypothetical protein